MCISVRWVISRAVKNEENITKAGLYTRSFESFKIFPQTSLVAQELVFWQFLVQ